MASKCVFTYRPVPGCRLCRHLRRIAIAVECKINFRARQPIKGKGRECDPLWYFLFTTVSDNCVPRSSVPEESYVKGWHLFSGTCVWTNVPPVSVRSPRLLFDQRSLLLLSSHIRPSPTIARAKHSPAAS
jgi:hypothetical protein